MCSVWILSPRDVINVKNSAHSAVTTSFPPAPCKAVQNNTVNDGIVRRVALS